MPASFWKAWNARLRAFYNRLRGIEEIIRTPENSRLNQRQIGGIPLGESPSLLSFLPCIETPLTSVYAETGQKALKILGIEESAIAKNDLVIFLYAVGLVGRSTSIRAAFDTSLGGATHVIHGKACP